MQKTFIGLATLTMAMLLHAGSLHAQNYPWCAQYSGDVGGENCGFVTIQQCQATVSGIGGYCYQNPMFQAQANQVRRRYRQTRY